MVFAQIDQNHRKTDNMLCVKSCTLLYFQRQRRYSEIPDKTFTVIYGWREQLGG